MGDISLELTLFATSSRGRKAYKNDTGTLYLECTSCKSIKTAYNFQQEKIGFLNRRYNCYECRSEENKQYRIKGAMAK